MKKFWNLKEYQVSAGENGYCSMSTIYRITYNGTAFGDNLFSAYVTKVLQKHGYDARLDNSRIASLVDCPIFVKEDELSDHQIKTFGCIRKNRTGSQTTDKFTVYSDLLKEFSEQFSIEDEIKASLNYVPVKFNYDASVCSCDVAMVTETGWWTPYRNWPYFDELKEMLSAASISYIDLSQENIRGNLALNVVRNCKLFLGLETGVSHYVSKFANGKALILQSGYTPFKYWAGVYDYKYMNFPVSCSPCWKRSDCAEHNCMVLISAESVYQSIVEELKL